MNIKLILRYLTNNVLLQLLGIIFSGASVKMLTLSELGLFNLAKSLASSFQYTHLGLRYSLDRFLPEGNTDSNTKILHITIIVNSIISFLLFIFYCFLYKFNFFLLCYILGGWLFATFSLIRVYNRGIGQLNYFVYLTFISNILVIVIPFIGLYFKGEKGLFLGYMCITFFLLIKYFPKELFNIKFVFNKIDFIKFFNTGIPLFISNFATFFGENIDKFMINHFLGLRAVGEFSIITLVYSLILMFPSLVVELIFTEYIKQKESKNILKNIILKHIIISSILILFSILLSYFVLPSVLDYFFPKYYYLIPQIKIIVLAIIPYIFISPSYCLLFAHDESIKISIVNVISLLLYFIAIYFLLLNSYTVEYILYSKIIYVIFYSIGLLFLLWKCGLINKYYLNDK